jgi:hypothetical protein
MNTSVDSCDELLTIPQFTGTCWFNSELTITFFSDLMRKFIIKNMSNICQHHYDKPKFLELLVDLLSNDYENNPRNNNYFYNKLKPENILLFLHDLDSKKFAFDPRIFSGNSHQSGYIYFDKLASYLKTKHAILYLSDWRTHNHDLDIYLPTGTKYTKNSKNKFHFDLTNYGNVFRKVKRIKDINFDFGFGFDDLYNTDFNTNYLPKKSGLWKFLELNNIDYKKYKGFVDHASLCVPDEIDVIVVDSLFNKPMLKTKLVFKNATFMLDAVDLGNFNFGCGGHKIAGITCKNNKYIYNGLSYNDKRKLCPLFNYDWTKEKKKFCMSSDECKLIKNCSDKYKQMFNPTKGEKTYFYVRESLQKIDDTVIEDPKYLSSLLDSVKKVKKEKSKPISEKKKKTIVYTLSPQLQEMSLDRCGQ